ncbi:MAG: phosphotransferase [Anaerolineae bacterium]|nr:phosphotransferase [Anaerolineae bacterium]
MSTLAFDRLPLALQEKISRLTARPVLIGESGTKVFQLSRDHTPTCYLKIATDMAPRELHIERDRLVWLRDKLPVPDVLFYGEDADAQYLLLSVVEGVDASVLAEREDGDPLLLVTALAEGLRQIHAVPIEDCPLQRRLDFMLGEAWKRVERLLVDEDDFDDERHLIHK